MTPTLNSPRLSAHISDRGQFLVQHTFTNWFRIVSHLKQRRNAPPATLSLSIGAPGVTEVSDSLAEGQGMPIFWFHLTFECSPLTSIALSSARASGSGSRTCVGHEVAIPARPLTTSSQSLPEAPALTHRADGGSRRPVPINEHVNEELPILRRVNPRRGPTSGGDEVDLIVSNLPPTIELCARFGSKIVSTVSRTTLRVSVTAESLS